MSLSSSMRNEHQTDGDYRTTGTEEDIGVGSIPPSLFRIDHWTASPVLPPNLHQRWKGASAFGQTKSTARLESAAGRHRMQRRDRAFDRTQGMSAPGLQVRNGLEKSASVRM